MNEFPSNDPWATVVPEVEVAGGDAATRCGWLVRAAVDHEAPDISLGPEPSRIAAAAGFDAFFAAVWLPIPASRPTLYVAGDTDPAWCPRSADTDDIELDPMVQRCRQVDIPFAWSDGPLDPAAAGRGRAVHCGSRYGWSVGVRDPLGVRGVVSLAEPNATQAPTTITRQKAAIRPTAHRIHHSLLATIRERLRSALSEDLTPRELEVLRWFADGKVAEDIATLINVKPTTVRFHVKNAAMKLGATNTTAAVYKALILGLVIGIPGDAVVSTGSTKSTEFKPDLGKIGSKSR